MDLLRPGTTVARFQVQGVPSSGIGKTLSRPADLVEARVSNMDLSMALGGRTILVMTVPDVFPHYSIAADLMPAST